MGKGDKGKHGVSAFQLDDTPAKLEEEVPGGKARFGIGVSYKI